MDFGEFDFLGNEHVWSLAGIYVYQRQEKSGQTGSGRIDISTSGLRRGQYVVSLNVDGKSYAEKVSVR